MQSFFFVKELLSLAEPLSNVTNSSILKNPHFGGVSAWCYGYCDELDDWWMKLSV